MTAPGDFTLGVEEEYLVVDPQTREPLCESQRLIRQATARIGDDVKPELQLAQVEVSTGVCTTLAEVRRELVRLRRDLGAVAAETGAAIAASASHPFADWEKVLITPKESYLRLERDYQQLAREQLICGCHVHVGISDREEAIQVLNRVRPWLSPILALSSNSPFWMGSDTGYASYRTEIWRRWPLAGIPEVFESRAEYDRLLDVLLATGSIDAPARLYLDVRPSARFGTLEFRVADVCLSVDEAVCVAALLRALARTCHAQAAADQPLTRPRAELLRSATWRAARYGLEGDLIDVGAERRGPAAEVVESLLGFVRHALETAGEWDEVSALVRETLARGTGATRQRAAFARAGRFEDVVDMVVAETAAGPTS